MSDPSADTPFPAPRVAASFGVLFLAALALVALLNVRDRANVRELEYFEEITAVGDTTYFALPAQPGAAPAATFEGVPLRLVSPEVLDPRDTEMRRVGRDPASGLTIYRWIGRSKDAQKQPHPEAGDYFLKVEPNRYVKVRAAR